MGISVTKQSAMKKDIQRREAEALARFLFHSSPSPASLKRAENTSISAKMMMDMAEL